MALIWIGDPLTAGSSARVAPQVPPGGITPWTGEGRGPNKPPMVDHLAQVDPMMPTASSAAMDSVRNAPTHEGLIPTPTHPTTMPKGAYEAHPSAETRQPAVTAGQIMTASVVTLPPGAAPREAREIFRRRKFRHIPVVAENGRPVGIVTDRYLFHPEPPGAEEPATVGEAMTRSFLTATPDTEIREIARAMTEQHVGCLPIVDPWGRLVGILTVTDVLHCIVNRAPLDLWV